MHQSAIPFLIRKIVHALTQSNIAEELTINKVRASRYFNGTGPDNIDPDLAGEFFTHYPLKSRLMPEAEDRVIQPENPEDAPFLYRMALASMHAYQGQPDEWSSYRTAINALFKLGFTQDKCEEIGEVSTLCDEERLREAQSLYRQLPGLACVPACKREAVRLFSRQNQLSIEMVLEKYANGGLKAESPFIRESEQLVQELIEQLGSAASPSGELRVFLRTQLVLVATPLIEAYFEADRITSIAPLLDDLTAVFGNAHRSDFVLLSVAIAWQDNQDALKAHFGLINQTA